MGNSYNCREKFSNVLTPKKVAIIAVVTIGLIFLYGIMMGIIGDDGWWNIMDKKYINIKFPSLGTIDDGIYGWSISYYLFYLTMGLLFPCDLYELFAMGAVWEYTETYWGMASKKLSESDNKVLQKFQRSMYADTEEGYLISKASDIIFNGCGLLTAYGINRFLRK